LRQILTNLAGNAIKFTTEGEVIVRACLEEESESECMLRFAVRDTGMGIPEDKLGILFDKFSQVDASTTRTFGGTGLGLAISKQLAECMGGEMGVTSEVGKGSEFWFTVRLGRSHRAEAARPEIHKTARLDGVRVLIIDDNATSREILSALTASWGMRPDEAEGGPWGLQAIYKALGENDPFRIVITDMQMPGMDGEAVGRAIRADARLADTRLVMLTSLGVRHGAQHYEEIGFSSCATKPIRRVELLNLLSQALGDPADRMAEPAKMPEPAAPQQSPVALTAAALGNARILLAEDNFTNQEVALGILKKLGMRADAVANGMEVLKSLETIPYDLVFMDVRMPVMDGIEATRRIRDARTPVLNHAIPIVAMTANALQADRESCLRAGMNGFVPKPIVPAVLREALEQWLPAVDSKAAATRQAPAAAPVPEVDAAVFDREGMLKRLMRDERLVGKVLDAFLGDLPLQIQALKESLAAGDANVSGRVAHSIKGAAANVGGEGLRQVAAGMEKAADGGDLDAVKGALAELEAKALELTLAIEASRPASQDAVKG
jgi:CheY-like chemotaxis protein/HPt (histidine-containing phosphotransfer) domain-containing protein